MRLDEQVAKEYRLNSITDKNRLKTSLLLAAVVFVIVIILFKYNLWLQWGVPHFEPTFLDTHALLSASDCNLKGYDVYKENPCDALKRPHVYSRIWLSIGYIGLGREHLPIIGAILVVLFYVCAIWILKPGNFTEFFVSLAFLVSPPFMLCVERANNDIIVFILLSVAGAFMISNKATLQWFSHVLIYLATFLKFYPAISFGAFVYYLRNNKVFWAVVLISIGVIGCFVWATYDDFIAIATVVPRPDSLRFTFGSKFVFDCLGYSDYSDILKIVFTVFVFLITGLSANQYKIPKNQVSSNRRVVFFLIGSFNLIFCFFLNTNFYYRYIFMVMTLPFLFDLIRRFPAGSVFRRLVRAFFIFSVLALWNELFINLIMSTIQKALQWPEPVLYTIYLCILTLGHLSAWGIIVILLFFTYSLCLDPGMEKLRWLTVNIVRRSSGKSQKGS